MQEIKEKNISIEKYDFVKKEIKKNRKSLERKIELFANSWLLETYNIPLQIPIKINGRLKRAGGRFTREYDIETNKTVAGYIDIAEWLFVEDGLTGNRHNLIDTVKHELVHYALFTLGLPHRDNDIYFIKECERLEIDLSIESYLQPFHIYTCSRKHVHYKVNQIHNMDFVSCGCGSKLVYEGQKVIQLN